jgi:hypothetical protein
MPPADEGVRSASASAGTAGGRLGREMPVERRVASGRGGGGRDAHTEGESWLGAEGEAMPMRWDWRRRRAAVVVVLIREWGDSGGRFERGTETVTPLPDGGGIFNGGGKSFALRLFGPLASGWARMVRASLVSPSSPA